MTNSPDPELEGFSPLQRWMILHPRVTGVVLLVFGLFLSLVFVFGMFEQTQSSTTEILYMRGAAFISVLLVELSLIYLIGGRKWLLFIGRKKGDRPFSKRFWKQFVFSFILFVIPMIVEKLIFLELQKKGYY